MSAHEFERCKNERDSRRRGYRRESQSQVILMAYRQNSPVIPKAASSFVLGRNFSVLMMTLYVAARVLNKFR